MPHPDVARAERRAFIEAARWGVIAASPRLRFDTVAEWWVGRFARKVASGERRERTLELHRYHLDRHLLPELGRRLIRHITTADVADLLDRLRERGRSGKTIAGALATLASVMRFAVRNGWIADSPVGKLETDERPHPARRTQRVLGREEIARLMDACLPAYRALIATALLTGMRLSELLGLIWDDIDLVGGAVHVRAQIDLHLDVVQVSRILGHASVSTTLDVYAHLFDEARHAADIRARMADSAFAGLLNPDDDRTVIVLPAAVERGTEGLSGRERAAIRWAT